MVSHGTAYFEWGAKAPCTAVLAGVRKFQVANVFLLEDLAQVPWGHLSKDYDGRRITYQIEPT